MIVDGIEAATSSIWAMLFMYQSGNIHQALLDALAREVSVHIIFDRRQQFIAGPRIAELLAAGAYLYYDKHEKSMRDQWITWDDQYIIAGSYLYDYTSEIRYVCSIFKTDDPNIQTEYYNNFFAHVSHSEPIVFA